MNRIEVEGLSFDEPSRNQVGNLAMPVVFIASKSVRALRPAAFPALGSFFLPILGAECRTRKQVDVSDRRPSDTPRLFSTLPSRPAIISAGRVTSARWDEGARRGSGAAVCPTSTFGSAVDLPVPNSGLRVRSHNTQHRGRF